MIRQRIEKLLLLVVLLMAAAGGRAQTVDPYTPVKQTDGSWKFKMPGANKLLGVTYTPWTLTLENNGEGSVGFDGSLPTGVTPFEENGQIVPGKFNVERGTEVTVKATPATAHYLSGWSGITTGDTSTDLTRTFTVDADMNVTATFTQCPVLTIAANDDQKGSVEVKQVPVMTELTSVDDEWQNQSSDGLAISNLTGFSAITKDEAEAWTGAPATGNCWLVYGFSNEGHALYAQFNNGTLTATSSGVSHATIYSNLASGIKYFYPTGYGLPAGMTASTTSGQYYVDPGTDVTVTATPAALNYFKNWTVGTTDQDDALSLTTATYSTTMTKSDLAVTANFMPYPTLTIATNDSQMGSVEIPYNKTMTLEYSVNSSTNAIVINGFPFTVPLPNNTLIGRISDPHPSAVSLTNKQIIISEPCDGDFLAYGEYEDLVIQISCHVHYVATPVANTSNQFQVAPGKKLRIAATAAENCHMEGWTDAAADAYDTGITYSDYTISSPSQMFPAKSMLSLTMGTANQTATANFAFNGYFVTVPAGQYITYCAEKPVTLLSTETNVALYTISDVKGSTATLASVSKASAQMPLLIHNSGTTEKTVLLQITTAPTPTPTYYSGFHGTLTASTIEASDDIVSNYALNGKQFVIVRSDLPIGANKCWLSVSATPARARAITFVSGDDCATGIFGISGQSELSGDFYDLNGRKLNVAPKRKGVYIQNGQKVVIR